MANLKLFPKPSTEFAASALFDRHNPGMNWPGSPLGVMRLTRTSFNSISAFSAAGILSFCAVALWGAESPPSSVSRPVPAKPDSSGSWAFKPIVRPPVPAAVNAKLETRTPKRTPIDQFILAKLAGKELSLAAPADKATLLRRVTFDLIGLPPTPGDLDAFLTDRSPEAFARVVDRLLASPHYGERWARHWLDLARFSESDGFEYDKMREHAWHYRDYLIRSFNDDKPYARFAREQIAGDALEPATRDGIIATGFLVAGPYDEAGNSSVSVSLKARIREEEMEDVIAAVGQTFLGMTVNCARCHDHKFDPIPQQDYYRLKAALDGVRHGNRDLITPGEKKLREDETIKIKSRVAGLETEVAAIEAVVRSKLLQERQAQAGKSQDAAPAVLPVQPLARWTFEGDAKDSVGTLRGTLLGGARIANGRLVLDCKSAYVRTEPLSRELREKTLEAWVTLSGLSQQGGGVLSVEVGDGGEFDAIVFGERVPRKWTAGSSFFNRTRDRPTADEDTKPGELIHVAIAYHADNSIALYRNGAPYGETYTPSGPNSNLQAYAARVARLLLGLRHTGAGNGFLAGEIEEARLYDRALSAEEIRASAKSLGASIVTGEDLAQAMTQEQRRRRETLQAEIETQRTAIKTLPAIPPVYAVVSRQPEPTFVLARGDIEKRKSEASAGGLSAVASLACDFAVPTNAPEVRRRLLLADWIVNPENPLTWRVIVNRVWHYHFGRGLVATPNDFGVNGERPTHPELLDWLASEFLAQGGSLKKLHRLILLSATYQQSSAAPVPSKDVDNRLLSRFPLRRLEAESVRDAMLSASGQLNPQMGGPGFRPFKVTVSGSHFYELIDPDGADFNRRSIYRMNIQSGKDPLLDSLDCPDPSTKTPARGVTTTPIQSLGLMNNAFVQRQCRFFAERLARERGLELPGQIKLAYRLAYAREPRRDELKQAIEQARDHGMESLCWVLLNSSEFLYLR